MVEDNRPAPRTPAQMRADCEAFNRLFDVGKMISVYPGSLAGPSREVEFLSPGAHVLGGHTAVVQVTGGAGCIAQTHVVEWRERANG